MRIPSAGNSRTIKVDRVKGPTDEKEKELAARVFRPSGYCVVMERHDCRRPYPSINISYSTGSRAEEDRRRCTVRGVDTRIVKGRGSVAPVGRSWTWVARRVERSMSRTPHSVTTVAQRSKLRQKAKEKIPLLFPALSP